ncbi:MAG: hypothetical protein GY749_38425, partial [Desulfobacteraceae bacterium]|nr:hypothetical protein [Desulfobacteraceae bacterium]
MQKTNYILSFIILSWFFLLSSAFSKDPADFQIASSPNPVGSGARAIGMGGAFIGVADDATAAFWNPGGLVQLKKPEISGVGNWFHRIEDNTFWEYPESNGSQSVTSEDINYLSIVYPFNIYDRSMVISLNYQHLYDFTREWNYSVTHINQGDANMLNTIRNIDYQQDGMLSAVGLAYCVQITRNISFGFTLNIWDDNISSNTWDQNIHLTEIHKINSDIMLSSEYITRQKYSFSGFNSNIGMLWNVNDKLSIGLVCKTPFKADLSHEIIRES